MFITLLVVTFALAFAVSFIVMRMFDKPIAGILKRVIVDDIHLAWQKYIKFAILVVGISSGVRIWDLEKYVRPVRILEGEPQPLPELNLDTWVLEVYRTIIETLQGVAWMLLVFFVVALIAYVFARLFESLRGRHGISEVRQNSEPPAPPAAVQPSEE